MYVDTGTSQNGPFEHYQASPEVIEASAVELDRSYGNVEALSADVDTTHRMALTGISGTLAGPMAQAPAPQRQNAKSVMGAAVVAAGSVRVFGFAVERFDQGVDALNERWRQATEADFGVAPATHPTDANAAQISRADAARDDQVLVEKIALFAELANDYRNLYVKLDDDAGKSAAQLQAGPTDQIILDLYAAGGLPSTVVHAFPHLQFTTKALPSDLAAMSDAELAEYLRQHPDLLNNPNIMAAVRERIEALTAEDGARDASYLRAAELGSMGVPDSAVTDALGTLELVGLYGKYAQDHDLTMPDGAASYLTSLFDGVAGKDQEIVDGVPMPGGDATIRVAEWIGDNRPELLGAYANGLMVLSDDGLHEDFGIEAVPQAVTDALEDLPHPEVMQTETENGLIEYTGLAGGEGFREFAELMAQATAEPGLVLAGDMTESVGQLAELIGDTASDQDPLANLEAMKQTIGTFGPMMQDTIEVASRNEEANEMLLWKANNDLYPDVKDTLSDLYTFPWPDSGEAVSGYTDWIADARASGDPERLAMANQASADLINFVTDTGGDGERNVFKALMQDGGIAGQLHNGPISLGEYNSKLVEGFGRVASSNLDALGGDNPLHDTTYEEDGTISVSLGDRSRLFTLVGTDDTASTTLSQTIGAYEQSRLDAVLTNENLSADERAAQLQDLGAEANRLGGYMAGGLLNASMITNDGEYQNAQQAYADHMSQVNVGKTIVTGTLGEIPVVGGAVSRGVGLFYDEVITKEIDVPPVPTGIEVGEIGSDDYLGTVAAYDYVSAQDRANQALPGLGDEYFENGKLKAMSDLSSKQLQRLDDHLADDVNYENYIEKYHGAAPFNDVAINDEGTHDEQGVRDYLNGDK